jgi:hypothetical protein
MTKVIRIAFMCIVLFPLTVQALVIKTSLEAVRALGHEMSEMRHMLEIYAMIGTGVSFRLPKEQMKTSITLYEDVITQIEKSFHDKEIKQQILISRNGWIPVKKALETSLLDTRLASDRMKKEAIYIHGHIRKVIKAMEAMKEHLLSKTKFKAIKELNAAIEIDASSRRLSAHYAMWMWDLDDPTIEAHWQKGVKIYASSLALLEASTFVSDPVFKKALICVRQQLKIFLMMHDAASRKVFTPALIQIRSEKACNAAIKMIKVILKP